MTKQKVDYFKGVKKEWTQLFRTYYRSPNEAETKMENDLKKFGWYKPIKYCEWYVIIDGDINFGTVNPLNKNGSINWDHLNKQVSKFIDNCKKAGGKKILIEITSRNTCEGLLDNHYVTGDMDAIEG